MRLRHLAWLAAIVLCVRPSFAEKDTKKDNTTDKNACAAACKQARKACRQDARGGQSYEQAVIACLKAGHPDCKAAGPILFVDTFECPEYKACMKSARSLTDEDEKEAKKAECRQQCKQEKAACSDALKECENSIHEKIKACKAACKECSKACKSPKGCTMEAKLCPDGSSVGRTGPNCKFAACPKKKDKKGDKNQ